VFVTIAIVYVLVKESWVFFEHVPLSDFLFDTQWTPLFDDAHYGIMVLLSGTLTSSAVALVVAIPLGTIIAIYLSEFAALQGARDRQALPRTAGRRADHRLRLLRPDLRDADAAEDLSRPARLQPAVGRPGDGHHDHSLRRLALRGRHARRADERCARAPTRWARRACRPRCVGGAGGDFSGIASAYILGISRAVGETMISPWRPACSPT
jgi:phosphate transport system permease protein